MARERKPRHPIAKNHEPSGAIRYRVQDGDSWSSLAARCGLKDAWSLIEFNFGTRSSSEVNWYLHHHIGCKRATKDRKNWLFSSDADPGIIFLPAPREHRSAGRGDYEMREDDSFRNVAFDHGHLWKTVWDAPQNEELRSVRHHPEAVMPGDRVHIPALSTKTVGCATGTVHTFQRLGKREELGTLLIYTDLRDGEVAHAKDAFTLKGSGGYRVMRSPKDDHIVDDDGISLIFTGMPVGDTYTFSVTLSDGEEMNLFEDVPFEELHRQSSDLETTLKDPE